jgi:hypothetical protein
MEVKTRQDIKENTTKCAHKIQEVIIYYTTFTHADTIIEREREREREREQGYLLICLFIFHKSARFDW